CVGHNLHRHERGLFRGTTAVKDAIRRTEASFSSWLSLTKPDRRLPSSAPAVCNNPISAILATRNSELLASHQACQRLLGYPGPEAPGWQPPAYGPNSLGLLLGPSIPVQRRNSYRKSALPFAINLAADLLFVPTFSGLQDVPLAAAILFR